VAGWGVVAALVAARFFRWEAGLRGTGRPGAPRTPAPVPAAAAVPAGARAAPRPPSTAAMVFAQARAANRSAWRDPGSIFFALVMPVGLYVLILSTQAVGAPEVEGVPFPVFYAASMVAYGTGVAVFLDLPQAVMLARDRGVLKRLRGTPLRTWQYLAGRMLAGLWLAVIIAGTVLVVGVAFFDVTVPATGLLVGLAGLLLGALTMAACGLAVASRVSSAKAVGAVGLIILLPLAFFSGVFVVGGPAWMTRVGSFFPLLHVQRVLKAAWDPGGAGIAWGSFGVLLLWLVGAGLLAVRYFRWESRPG
jgi:hypothetical protein